MFCRSLLVLLAIVLSVLFLFTDSNDPFGIFKLFFHCCKIDRKVLQNGGNRTVLPIQSMSSTVVSVVVLISTVVGSLVTPSPIIVWFIFTADGRMKYICIFNINKR